MQELKAACHAILLLSLFLSYANAAYDAPLVLRGNNHRALSSNLRRQRTAICMASPVAFADSPGTLAQMLGMPDFPADGMAIFGGAGFLVGFCTKKMGKAALGLVAVMGVGEKILESNGYLTVHWDKVHADMTKSPHFKWLDSDGDGRLTFKDIQKSISKSTELVKETFEKNSKGLGVAGSSFATGLAAGFIAG